MARTSEMPRDYMARCAQFGRRGIFQYREELLAGCEYLRFIGAPFASEAAARAWDDSPGQFDPTAMLYFPTWEDAEGWLFSEEDER